MGSPVGKEASMTLRTAIGRFLMQLDADGRSPLTRQVYAGELGRFAKWRGAGTQVRAVRPDDIGAFVRRVEEFSSRGPVRTVGYSASV